MNPLLIPLPADAWALVHAGAPVDVPAYGIRADTGRGLFGGLHDGGRRGLVHTVSSSIHDLDHIRLNLTRPTDRRVDGALVAALLIAERAGLDVSRGVTWERSGAREIRIRTASSPGGQQVGATPMSYSTRIFTDRAPNIHTTMARPDLWVVVPALASIDPAAPHADRHALAVVLAHTFGGSP